MGLGVGVRVGVRVVDGAGLGAGAEDLSGWGRLEATSSPLWMPCLGGPPSPAPNRSGLGLGSGSGLGLGLGLGSAPLWMPCLTAPNPDLESEPGLVACGAWEAPLTSGTRILSFVPALSLIPTPTPTTQLLPSLPGHGQLLRQHGRQDLGCRKSMLKVWVMGMLCISPCWSLGFGNFQLFGDSASSFNSMVGKTSDAVSPCWGLGLGARGGEPAISFDDMVG